MRKSRKKLILKFVCVLVLIFLALFGMNRFYSVRIDRLSGNLAQLTGRLNDYETSTKTVVCAAADIKAGERISAENLTVIEISEEAVPSDVCMSIKDALGVSRISLSAGTYLTAGMIAESKPDDDIRELEIQGIQTFGNIEQGECVDIRILYPDGTDYVVMSKKTVFGTNPEAEGLTMRISEEELLLMDSAMVDAYLFDGAVIYATAYIERELQSGAEVNYIPSVQAMDLIENDPNITKITSRYLLTMERARIEGRLSRE